MRRYSPIWLMIIKLSSFSPLVIAAIFANAQNENTLIVKQLPKSFSPVKDIDIGTVNSTNNSILQVDSIANTNTISSYFCKVYSKSMQNIALQIQTMDSWAKAFIQKFEIGFANYFLNACYANNEGTLLPGSVWNCYYSSHNAKPWQLILIGVNAHINGDIWHALVDNFSELEIRWYKKEILATQSSIAKVYDDVFDTIKSESSYLRFINFFTLGLAKKFGERTFFKWRNRSINLAIMYYHNQKKFKRRLAVVTRKKQKIDKLILSYRPSTTNQKL